MAIYCRFRFIYLITQTNLCQLLQITFTMDNLLESVARVRNRKFHMNVARLPQLMDPEFWFESPALVDAYYVPPRNEMG